MTLSTPDKPAVESFMQASVLPPLEAVARELTYRSRPASVARDARTGTLTLTAPAESHRDFVYGVQMSEHKLPAFTALEATNADVRYEARTFFSDGSRGYDIMGMTDGQIIKRRSVPVRTIHRLRAVSRGLAVGGLTRTAIAPHES